MTAGPGATTASVWAQEVKIVGNPVRQLLVPESGLEVREDTGGLYVAGVYGRWPALRGADAAPGAPLTARIPVVAGTRARVTWSGSRDLLDPASVTDSYTAAIGFRAPGEPGSLRRPQLGALHSALGYWTSGLADPGIIVMPTGTGKTETMLALLVAARLGRLLVIVPTTALRSQVAAKFETLGVLQGLGVVGPSALRPVAGRLEQLFRCGRRRTVRGRLQCRRRHPGGRGRVCTRGAGCLLLAFHASDGRRSAPRPGSHLGAHHRRVLAAAGAAVHRDALPGRRAIAAGPPDLPLPAPSRRRRSPAPAGSRFSPLFSSDSKHVRYMVPVRDS